MKQLAVLITVMTAFSCIQVDYVGITDFYIENQTALDLYLPSYYHLESSEQEQYLSKDLKEIDYIRIKAKEKVFIRQDEAIGGCPPAQYAFHKIQLYRLEASLTDLTLVYQQDPVDNSKWEDRDTSEWTMESNLKIHINDLVLPESSY